MRFAQGLWLAGARWRGPSSEGSVRGGPVGVDLRPMCEGGFSASQRSGTGQRAIRHSESFFNRPAYKTHSLIMEMLDGHRHSFDRM